MRTFDFTGTFTAVQPLATCSKDLNDKGGGSGKPIPVPSLKKSAGEHLYFPATGIRGALRRSARDLIRNMVIEKTGNPTPFSLDQHYFLTLGGIKGSGDMDRSTVAMENHWRSVNPLLSLFGAGDAGVLGFVTGHLSVSNAVTKLPCEPVQFSGARSDDIYRDKQQARFLTDDDLDSLIARSQGNKSRSVLQSQVKALEKDLKKHKTDAEKSAALQAQIDSLKAQITSVKGETGADDVSVGMPLAGWQAIPEGETLDVRFTLYRATDVELGLFLKALNQFALFPVLGAHRANGNGLVSGSWTVDEVGTARTAIGTINFDALTPMEIHGDVLTNAVKAFDEWFASGQHDFSIPHAEIEA